MPTPEERLQELGLTLPTVASPVANYVPYVRSGKLLFVSGQVARTADAQVIRGKLGDTMSVEEGYQAARACTLYGIAAMKAALGELQQVRQVVRLIGMVNATPDFEQHSQVVNGASDLLAEVFGNRGPHARATVGMASLPLGTAVEVEFLVEVGD